MLDIYAQALRSGHWSTEKHLIDRVCVCVFHCLLYTAGRSHELLRLRPRRPHTEEVGPDCPGKLEGASPFIDFGREALLIAVPLVVRSDW